MLRAIAADVHIAQRSDGRFYLLILERSLS